MLMSISEERLQILLPRGLKEAARERAQKLGISLGEYVRALLDADLEDHAKRDVSVFFPFGYEPVRGGRPHGSENHDGKA